MGRVLEEEGSEHAAGFEDGCVGGAGAVADGVLVGVGEDADEGFEAETEVNGVEFEPLLREVHEGGEGGGLGGGEGEGTSLLQVDAERRSDVGRVLLAEGYKGLHAAAANRFFLVGYTRN